jgi:N-methylhydantoinase B
VTVAKSTFDPVTLEIFWQRLIAICDEMAATLQHTAFSSVVREARDFACALFDSGGNMLAQASNSTSGLLGSTFVSVKNICQHYPPEQMIPGDILVTNDPWLCTGHLLDITMVTPVFHRSRLVAFAACVVHHLDIGGRAQSPEASEVYEEGLNLPVLKLYKAGEPNEDLYAIIRSNVRASDKVLGDIHAQVAASLIAVTRVRELLDEERLESLDQIGHEILGRSEQAMRAMIAQIPDGTYRHGMEIDGFDEPLHLQVAITVRGTEMLVDYTGTSSQIKRGLNCVLNMTRSSTLIGVRCAVDPKVPNNQGVILPVHVTAPGGSLLNTTPPSPVVARSTVAMQLPSAVFGALSQAIPQRVVATSGTLWILAFDGRDNSGRPYLVVQMVNGGMGARPHKDGLSARSYPGNVSPTSAELLEADMPIIVERKALLPDSGGPGRYRGGCGQEFRIKVREDARFPVRVAIRADRLRYPAPGVLGGRPGSLGSLMKNGEATLHDKRPAVLAPGDVVSWCVPGGGGFWDPLGREPEAVGRDFRRGLVSMAAAWDLYGVVLDTHGRVDGAATVERRRTLAGAGEELKG